MSSNPGPRASELAAGQVEQIVAAAQAAAEQMRTEAEAERRQISVEARREAQEAVEAARRSAEAELAKAHKQAIVFGQDARREAEALIGDAQDEAAQIREKARRTVDGRVAAAERAAAEVLEEARALSGGLRQLGKALEDHADRILRDVTAAHKRMQSDLRVVSIPGEPSLHAVPAPGESTAADTRADSSPARRRPRPVDGGERAGSRTRGNPFEEIELPSWVGREG